MYIAVPLLGTMGSDVVLLVVCSPNMNMAQAVLLIHHGVWVIQNCHLKDLMVQPGSGHVQSMAWHESCVDVMQEHGWPWQGNHLATFDQRVVTLLGLYSTM